MDIAEIVKLKFREEFRSAHSEAFQHWFEKLAVTLHGNDSFLAIRVTRGDGGLDGLALKEGRVYQIYAPPSLATDATAAAKTVADFEKALATLAESLKIWTFVHNSADGKLGHQTARALTQLGIKHPAVTIEAIGIDGLWERLAKLPTDQLATLFGVSNRQNQAESAIRAPFKRADGLADQNKHQVALEEIESAGATANHCAETHVGLDFSQLETIFSTLYPSGPKHHQVWSRAGGDVAALNGPSTGRAEWHAAIKLVSLGGGGSRIGFHTLLDVARQDFPNNPNLNAFVVSSRVELPGMVDQSAQGEALGHPPIVSGALEWSTHVSNTPPPALAHFRMSLPAPSTSEV